MRSPRRGSTQRGFTNGKYAYPAATIRGQGGPRSSVGDKITAAGHPGLLFFSSNYQPNTGNNDTHGAGRAVALATRRYWGDYGAYTGELYGIDTSVGGNLFALSNISAPSTGDRPDGQLHPAQPRRRPASPS